MSLKQYIHSISTVKATPVSARGRDSLESGYRLPNLELILQGSIRASTRSLN